MAVFWGDDNRGDCRYRQSPLLNIDVIRLLLEVE